MLISRPVRSVFILLSILSSSVAFCGPGDEKSAQLPALRQQILPTTARQTPLVASPVISMLAQGDYLTVVIGPYRVEIVPGDVTKQEVQALVVSHWPDTINDGGGIGGAIDSAGNNKVFEGLAQIQKDLGGTFQRRAVYPTLLKEQGRLPKEVKTILNVIELKAMGEFDVISEEAVDKMVFPLPQQGRDMMKAIIRKHQAAIDDYEAKLAKAKNEDSERDLLDLYVFSRRRYLGDFEKDMEQLWSGIGKKLGQEFSIFVNWDNVVDSFANVIAEAERQEINSIATGTLAYGIMGELNATQSIGAMLSGVAYHVATTDQSAVPMGSKTIRIVLYARDSAESRQSVRKAFEKYVSRLEWLSESSRMLGFWANTRGFDWNKLLGKPSANAASAQDGVPAAALTENQAGRTTPRLSLLQSCLRRLRGQN